MSRTPANKGRRLPAEHLYPEEVRALLRACSSRAPTGFDRALIAVLYRGGLRIFEALALHAKEVDQVAAPGGIAVVAVLTELVEGEADPTLGVAVALAPALAEPGDVEIKE